MVVNLGHNEYTITETPRCPECDSEIITAVDNEFDDGKTDVVCHNGHKFIIDTPDSSNG